MILQFPSQDVLQLAMQSGLISEQVQVSPAKLLVTEDCLTVESASKLTRTESKELKALDVVVLRRMPKGDVLEVTCWAQILALAPTSFEDCEQLTILFRLGAGAALTTLVSEILRLGNDRQSFRCFEHEGRDEALLRVTEPPYYSLLQAIDPSLSQSNGTVSPLVAYREQAPRVWVRLGYEHLRPEALAPPPGFLLLMDAPRHWEFVPEAQFRDIYQALDLSLPQPEQAWLQKEDLEPTIQVPLKLTQGDTFDTNSLWVLESNAMDQLEELVTSSDESLLGRLSFAVIESAEAEADPMVVLRSRPSRQSPPVLVLEGTAYRPYLNLPNLFMPNGFRLHPPLRRDAVARMLAKDKQKLTWLAPEEHGTFVPMSVPENAFRPMSDWVDYVLVHQQQPLKAWMDSLQFEFEPFVCKSDKPPRKKPLLDKPKQEKTSKPEVAVERKKPTKSSTKKTSKTTPKATQGGRVQSSRTENKGAAEREELINKLRLVQTEFMQSTVALDDEQRMAQWRTMGELNAELGNGSEASLSMSNLLWSQPRELSPELLFEWVQLEIRCRNLTEFGLDELDEILEAKHAQHRSASLAAAFILFNLASNTLRVELQTRLPALVQLFEQCERYLPVRTAWLAALALHKLSGGDTLGLARARDRLLDRLFQKGLQLEFDVPSFLRGRGSISGGADRKELLAQRSQELFQRIDEWIIEKESKAKTRAYVKLMQLYVTARQDEEKTLEQLDVLNEELNAMDEIHHWLSHTLRFRIEQQLKDNSERTGLPEQLQKDLDALSRMDRYKVDAFRRFSRILEPHLRIDPYTRYYQDQRGELDQYLASLAEISDVQILREKLQELLQQHAGGEHEQQVFQTALDLGPRVGEAIGLDIARRTRPILDGIPDPIEKALLLQRVIYVAAHYGSTELTQDYVDLLRDQLPAILQVYLTMNLADSAAKARTNAVESLLVESFRGLRRLGMREEIGRLYAQVEELVNEKQKPSNSKKKTRDLEQQQARSLRLLLCVASGWYYFGNNTPAEAIANQVQTLLFKGKLPKVDQCALAEAYVNAICMAPSEIVFERVFELFAKNIDERKLPNISDDKACKSHFSVSQLSFIENCLLALFNQSQKLSPEAQRLLDEDEFLVRKKIHQDMRELI